jgi:DNA-binding protein HU-beta
MKKADIINLVAARTELRKPDIAIIIGATIEIIMEEVAKGKKITFIGFGSFASRYRRPRLFGNPRGGNMVPRPARRVPYFHVSQCFKDMLWNEE